jgi:hypothetical protein
VHGDVALRLDLGPGVVKVNTDENVKFVGQDVLPSPIWLRHCSRYPGLLRRCSRTPGGCAVAASPRVGT